MSEPARPLRVSSPEQVILEAVIASEEIPKRIQKRARVIMLAGDGRSNSDIAEEMSIARPRVLHWRKRFEEFGIPGLWDVERVPPRERVAKRVEQAIVDDSLYLPHSRRPTWLEDDDSSRNWNVRNLARRHKVSPASVQRIWKRYGIAIGRHWNMDQWISLDELKISQDPLFPITVYQIGGLFYETVGPALALCSSMRPFSSLTFSSLEDYDWREKVDALNAQFRNLDPKPPFWPQPQRSFGRAAPAVNRFIEFVSGILAKPQHANAQIHLLVERQERQGAVTSSDAQAWLARQPRVHLHYPPWMPPVPPWVASDEQRVPTCLWSDLAERWLNVISEWPIQASFANSLDRMLQILGILPAKGTLDTLCYIDDGCNSKA